MQSRVPWYRRFLRPRKQKQHLTGWDWYPQFAGHGPLRAWSDDRAVNEGPSASSLVNTCLTWRGSIASVPLKAYKKTRDGKHEEAPDSPLQERLNNPNPFMDMGYMVRVLSDHVLLGGNGLWLKNRGRSGQMKPELLPLRPQDVQPVLSTETGMLTGYRLTDARGSQRNVAREDIIHIQRPNPNNPWWGMGVLHAGWAQVENERAAIGWHTALLSRQAIVPSVLGIGSTLGDDNWDRLKAEMDQRRLGEARAGEAVFVDGVGTLNVATLGLNPEQMALVESRRSTREDILSMFQVPPPLAGYLERANYANIETARSIFWQDVLVPFGQQIAATLTRSFAQPDFGPEWVIDFDFGSVDALQENLTDKLANFRSLLDARVRPEKAAEMLDLGLTADDFLPAPTVDSGDPSDADTKFAERIAHTNELARRLQSVAGLEDVRWPHIVTGPGAASAPGAYLQAALPKTEGEPDGPPAQDS